MSFWKSLFGGGAPKPPVSPSEEYQGFTIRATPMPVGGEYQLAGTIEKSVNGALRTYSFVRADRMSSLEDVTAMALAKGRLIIDEQGEGVFELNR